MMTATNRRVTRRDIDRIVRLIEREVSLRQGARLIELDPANVETAREIFRQANSVREERIRLLEACGLA